MEPKLKIVRIKRIQNVVDDILGDDLNEEAPPPPTQQHVDNNNDDDDERETVENSRSSPSPHTTVIHKQPTEVVTRQSPPQHQQRSSTTSRITLIPKHKHQEEREKQPNLEDDMYRTSSARLVSKSSSSESFCVDSTSDRKEHTSSKHGTDIHQSVGKNNYNTNSIQPTTTTSTTARYFVMKTFTQEHINISVKESLWATQPHNEHKLNDAFEESEVILLFSVNGSHNFQGYARMMSKIGRSKADVWTTTSWGGAFKVEWLKVYNLPFTETEDIKNPWNDNKPVKVCRDGQELPPHIGELLCQMVADGADGKTSRRVSRERDNFDRMKHRSSNKRDRSLSPTRSPSSSYANNAHTDYRSPKRREREDNSSLRFFDTRSSSGDNVKSHWKFTDNSHQNKNYNWFYPSSATRTALNSTQRERYKYN